MSETLYRINREELEICLYGIFTLDDLERKGWLVPVEPCEHGNYDRHPTALVLDGNGTEMMKWCPGAGIGDNK